MRKTSKGQIKSEQELGNLIYDAMKKSIDYVMVKLFQENEDLIEQYVYNAYQPEEYQRTREFLDAWNHTVKKTSDHHNISYISSRIIGEFHYDPSVMNYSPDFAQHGSPSWLANKAWGDARDHLADIIYGGNSGSLFGDGPWRKKRDAWGPLLKQMDRGKLFKWFEEGMRNQKLKI